MTSDRISTVLKCGVGIYFLASSLFKLAHPAQYFFIGWHQYFVGAAPFLPVFWSVILLEFGIGVFFCIARDQIQAIKKTALAYLFFHVMVSIFSIVMHPQAPRFQYGYFGLTSPFLQYGGFFHTKDFVIINQIISILAILAL
jgi:hypothetical protein